MKKSVKIILTAAVVVIAAVVVGLIWGNKKPTPEPTPVVDELVFEEVFQNDYDWAVENYGDSILFYESQVTFEEAIDTVEEFTIAMIMNVIQAADTCLLITHYPGEEPSVEKVNDFWLEDVNFQPGLNVTLKDAVEKLHESEFTLPNSNLMVLRNPLGPVRFDNPFYIFGNRGTFFLKVDAGTGEVDTIM